MDTQYFSFGTVVATDGVVNQLEVTDVMQLLLWHGHLKQGLLSDEDYRLNQHALTHQERIFSAYELREKKYYVITEWDRSVTTILTPEEY